MEDKRPKTIFCDLDGTLVKHNGDLIKQLKEQLVLLEGTLDKFKEWEKLGYKIIITTGRKESMRKRTIEQLEEVGIFYDELITNLGGGTRILINDRKANSDEDTAIAINLTRNEGIKNIHL
jgi:hydroxymethylpyrimidine pyrophosphatase-like HAD family hydrolase